MRVSKPGQKKVEKRNSKSDLHIHSKEDKKQPPTDIPSYDPDWEMQYGCSRKTGKKTGGHYWNPPDFCEKRIIPFWDERWVHAGTCHECFRWKSKTCSAPLLPKTEYADGIPVFDEPKMRKKSKRVETKPRSRRVSK